MNLIKLLISVILFQFLFSNAFGQLSPVEKEYYWKAASKIKKRPPFKTYSINEWDRLISEELTFNTPFNIKLTLVDSCKFGDFGVFLVNGNSEKIHPSGKSDKEGNYDKFVITKNAFEKKVFYLEIPPLLPHKEYSFIIPHHLLNKDLDSLHNYNHQLTLSINKSLKSSKGRIQVGFFDAEKKKIAQENLLKNEEFRKQYNQVISGQALNILSNQTYDSLQVTQLLDFNGFKLFSYEEYVYFFIEKLYDFYANIQKKYCVGVVCETKEEFLDSINTNSLEAFIKLSQKLISHNKVEEDILTSVSKFKDIVDNKGIKYLLLGDIPLKFMLDSLSIDDIEKTKINNHKRELNIENTLKDIKKIIAYSKMAKTSFLNSKDSLQFIHSAREVIKQQTEITKNYKEAKKVIHDNINNIFQLKMYYGSTYPKKYSNGLKNYLKADLGVQRFFGENYKEDASTNDFPGNFRPYFGLLYHPCGLNDDLPLKMQPLESRFFGQIGFTLGSIKVEGKRVDLFASNNIMTGVGFSFSRSVHVSIGKVWFKKIKNSEKNVHIAPYFSFGFHPDINTLASSITGLIFK